jgi:hypothetical protein
MRSARRCDPIVKENDKARMTNAELTTNDKSGMDKRRDNRAASVALDDVPALNVKRPTVIVESSTSKAGT